MGNFLKNIQTFSLCSQTTWVVPCKTLCPKRGSQGHLDVFKGREVKSTNNTIYYTFPVTCTPRVNIDKSAQECLHHSNLEARHPSDISAHLPFTTIHSLYHRNTVAAVYTIFCIVQCFTYALQLLNKMPCAAPFKQTYATS